MQYSVTFILLFSILASSFVPLDVAAPPSAFLQPDTPAAFVPAGSVLFVPSGLAEQFASLNEITGAVYADKTGQLVLLGSQKEGAPPLELDDFIKALQIVYLGKAPAVSIDPVSGDTTQMKVAYFGGIENSHFGWVLYEADRLLKIYSMGRDNLTGEPVESAVRGYKSELQLSTPDEQSAGEPVWHRIWLEPVKHQSTRVKVSSDRRAISFAGVRLTARTEYIQGDPSAAGGLSAPGDSSAVGSDPAAEAFVAHYNTHFTEYAIEQPVLYQLAMQQRYLIIARWLRDEGIPIDSAWLDPELVTPYATPESTLRIQASRQSGRYIVYLEGGVDLTQENEYEEDDPQVDALQKAVLANSSSGGLFLASLAIGGAVVSGVAFPFQWRSGTDSQGNVWGYEKLSKKKKARRLRYFKDGKSGVVINLDDNEQDRVSKITIGVSQNALRPVYQGERLVDIQIETGPRPEDRQEMARQVDALTAATKVWLDILRGLPPAEGVEIHPLYQMLYAQGALGVPDLIFFKRLGVINFAEHDINAVAVDQLNGGLIAQHGLERREFPGLSLMDQPPSVAPSDFIDFMFGDKANMVVIVPGIPDTKEQAEDNQRLTNILSLLAYQSGIAIRYRDDDPLLAFRNLTRHRPVIDQKGEWDIALVIDEDSFKPAQRELVEEIKSRASQAGIPVCAGFGKGGDDQTRQCLHNNLIFLTARPDMQLKPPPSGGAAGSPLGAAAAGGMLQGRALVLLVADQDAERSYARRYVTDYGAVGVTAYSGRVSLETLAALLEKLPQVARAAKPVPSVHPLYIQTVDEMLGNAQQGEGQRIDANTLKAGDSYISLRPVERSFAARWVSGS